jgi:hypothetical protein
VTGLPSGDTLMNEDDEKIKERKYGKKKGKNKERNKMKEN